METWVCPHCDRLFDLFGLALIHVQACSKVKKMVATAEDVERRRAMMRHPASGARR